MSILNRLALPALVIVLAAPAAMHAQSSGAPSPGSTTASPTAPQSGMPSTTTPMKKSRRSKSKPMPSTMPDASQPMPDPSMQGTPSTAKPGADPVNPTNSPEPPMPTTQGPPPAGTTPNTNQVAPHL